MRWQHPGDGVSGRLTPYSTRPVLVEILQWSLLRQSMFQTHVLTVLFNVQWNKKGKHELTKGQLDIRKWFWLLCNWMNKTGRGYDFQLGNTAIWHFSMAYRFVRELFTNISWLMNWREIACKYRLQNKASWYFMHVSDTTIGSLSSHVHSESYAKESA